MNNFNNIFDNLLPLRPLIPFVQSVLPTVFDDSLSYLETLGKVVKALNDTETNVNTLEDAIRAFADDLSEFENLTIYPVNMTFNESTGNYAADKTFADIDAALLEGRTPILHVVDRDGRNYYSAQLAKVGNTVFYWTTPLFYENGESVIFRAFINNSDVSGVIASPLDSGAVVVNYTTVSGSDTPVVDKTFEQISAALEDNKPVFLFVDSAYWIPLSRANRTGNDVDGYHYISAEFIYAIPVSATGGNNLGVGVYSVNTSDAWSVNRYAFPDAGRVNTLIDIKLAQLEGFESVKKLYYNENTGAVVIWDGEHMSPITGEEIIINILSATNIFPFMQAQGAVTDVFNLYVPLKYDASSANEAVQFYRLYNNNLEIISIPRSSNIATKSVTPLSGGLTPEAKQALLNCFANVAWVNDDGQTYYDALYSALYPSETLVSISAAFNQGSAVIYSTDSLDSLRQYLTVTAHYDDLSSVVTDYALSGTLSVGTSTITVSYGGKTTTFTVNVTAPATLVSISAVFAQGSAVIYDTDSIDTLRQYLTVTANMSDNTTRTVTDYTLSGTLAVGTSTITVSYGGMTTTFTVEVTSSTPIVTLTFRNDVAVAKNMAHAAGIERYGIYAKAATARASTTAPFANDNYVFTVTDSSKYSLAANDVTSLEQIQTTYSDASLDGYYYQGGTKTVSWVASDSVTTPYVWLALKKNDGTDFTSEELANNAAAVVTVTRST